MLGRIIETSIFKSKATKVYNISEMKQVPGSDLCSQLLFIHAFTGCDTTSCILNGESTIQSCANVFLLPHQARNVIEDYGTKAMAVLFGFTSRSWCGLERKVTWTQWIGDGNWWTTGSCQLWPVRLLPQKASCRWSTVFAQLPAKHNGAVAGHMDYHTCLLVDHVKLGIVRITIINLYGRKSVTTNGKSSGHSKKVTVKKSIKNKPE